MILPYLHPRERRQKSLSSKWRPCRLCISRKTVLVCSYLFCGHHQQTKGCLRSAAVSMLAFAVFLHFIWFYHFPVNTLFTPLCSIIITNCSFAFFSLNMFISPCYYQHLWSFWGFFFCIIAKHFVYIYFSGIPEMQLAPHHRHVKTMAQHIFFIFFRKLKKPSLYLVKFFFMISWKLFFFFFN